MRTNTLILIFCFSIFSCTKNKKTKLSQSIIIEDVLVMDVSEKMKFKEEKGTDSYVAYLISAKNDTFYIEYGNRGIISSLYSVSPPIFPLSQKENILTTSGKEPSPDEVIFSEYPEEDREQRIFDKNYYLYDTINNIVVKFVQPKQMGDGTTGIYIPRLNNGKSFSIYAKNLDSTSHQNALFFFKTIRYKK